jgi:hypothetical protein
MTTAYCQQCCVRRELREGVCPLCGSTCAPDDGTCPRSKDGHHNPVRAASGNWECSRCLAPVEPRPDADIVRVGQVHRH